MFSHGSENVYSSQSRSRRRGGVMLPRSAATEDGSVGPSVAAHAAVATTPCAVSLAGSRPSAQVRPRKFCSVSSNCGFLSLLSAALPPGYSAASPQRAAACRSPTSVMPALTESGPGGAEVVVARAPAFPPPGARTPPVSTAAAVAASWARRKRSAAPAPASVNDFAARGAVPTPGWRAKESPSTGSGCKNSDKPAAGMVAQSALSSAVIPPPSIHCNALHRYRIRPSSWYRLSHHASRCARERVGAAGRCKAAGKGGWAVPGLG
jgi:hypothetical protein